jgi:hypothetical protein
LKHREKERNKDVMSITPLSGLPLDLRDNIFLNLGTCDLNSLRLVSVAFKDFVDSEGVKYYPPRTLKIKKISLKLTELSMEIEWLQKTSAPANFF